MKVFKDFNQILSDIRTGIDNEVCSLFRNSDVRVFNVEDTGVSIQTNDEVISVIRIECENVGDTFNISLALDDGFDMDFTDCTTDDMVSLYETIFNLIK